MSVQQELSVYLEGSSKQFILDYQELEIKGEYSKISNQASLSIERMTFINDAALFIQDYIKKGDIYEGLKIKIVFKQFEEEQIVLDGFLDLTDDYEEVDPFFIDSDNSVIVRCKVTDLSSRDLFRDKIEGNSYAYLESIGVFKKNDYTDIDFVIEEDFEPLKFIFLLFMFFSILDKLQSLIQQISKTIAEIVAQASQLPNGSIVALLYSIAVLILQLAYFAFLLVTIFDIFYQILVMGSSPVYQNKSQSLYSLISKAVNYFGYEFETNISLMKDIYYMPSLPFDNSKNLVKDLLPFPSLVEKGIPSTGDFGYFVDQMINITSDLFNCKLAVINDVVHLKNVDDTYWRNSSTLKLKDVKRPTKRNNAGEIKGTTTVEFLQDEAETWTIRNEEGTSTEVKTRVKTPKKSIKYDLIKGLERTQIECALINRKEGLNITEEILKSIAESLQKLYSFVGGNYDFVSLLTEKVGVGKMSTSNTTVPKLVYLKNGRIPANHRDVLGAKNIRETFHKSKSFIADNYKAQKDVYLNIQNVPLDLKDFKKLVENAQVTTHNDEEAEVTEFSYKFPLNYANLSYEIPNIFTKNLKEIVVK